MLEILSLGILFDIRCNAWCNARRNV